MRTIGVVTTSRADYGIYLPILRRIQNDNELNLHLMVSGTHLSPEFGMTVNQIESDGFNVNERIEALISGDTPESIAKSMGLGLIGFAQAYSRFQPDILLVLGDRFEMHASALATLPFNIPLAHIHGGELTEGAIDNSLRHSISKLSHIHFPATQEYAKRLRQMGEEEWRVTVSGAPSLDNLLSVEYISPTALSERIGLDLDTHPLIVTYHPATLEHQDTERNASELLAALSTFDLPIVFTQPNADTNGRIIAQLIDDFIKERKSAVMVANMGTQGYFSLMNNASAMVGNSSSGIIEALSFGLPVVNIGTRQDGRARGINVIDVGTGHNEIRYAIQRATSPEFRARLQNVSNFYGDGRAAERIVERLKNIEISDSLIRKRFSEI